MIQLYSSWRASTSVLTTVHSTPAAEVTMAAVRNYMDLCARWARDGTPITAEENMKTWGMAQEASQLACRAVDLLFETAGARAVLGASRLQRYFRDIQMYRVHTTAQPPFATLRAQARLGMRREEHEAFFRRMLEDVDEPTLPFGLEDVHGDGAGIGIVWPLLPCSRRSPMRARWWPTAPRSCRPSSTARRGPVAPPTPTATAPNGATTAATTTPPSTPARPRCAATGSTTTATASSTTAAS